MTLAPATTPIPLKRPPAADPIDLTPRTTTIPLPDGRMALVETRDSATLVIAGAAYALPVDAEDRLFNALAARRLRRLGVVAW